MLARGEVQSHQCPFRSPRRQAWTIITNIIYLDQEVFRYSNDKRMAQSRDNLEVYRWGIRSTWCRPIQGENNGVVTRRAFKRATADT